MHMLFLLQGIFFQRYFGTLLPSGRATTVHPEERIGCYFGGIITLDQGQAMGGHYVGQMYDAFGSSELKNVMFDAVSHLSFEKWYQGRSKPVLYEFLRQDGAVWRGHWRIDDKYGDSNKARCLVTRIEESFLEIPQGAGIHWERDQFGEDNTSQV